MELSEIVKDLRKLLSEYRYDRIGSDISIHINAIEIAICLVEYAIKELRPIKEDEKWWFEASYHVDYVLSGSKWEKVSDL